MSRILMFLYGLVAYALFFVTILYAIGFVTGLVVPKTLHTGVAAGLGEAIGVNVALLALFAVQHLIMARPAFKEWWAQFVPRPIERSTFVIFASSILLLTFWQWRPMPEIVWEVGSPALRSVLIGVSLLGFGIVFYSSFLIDHFDLFGLRQVYLHLRRREGVNHKFMERSLYRLVRHPLMLGFLIAFWSAPTMTQGHLLFAAVTTAYIIVGTKVEERDLVRYLGDDYLAYRKRTPALMPLPFRKRTSAAQTRSSTAAS
ncbi:MAG: isoprenylcysteine carboxylmethyltransferase family protein [Planctomycetes bacterium]|nr:isoprenylcysteine carboxylmethyltransferase family protein [Planctomycetota bacterium]